MRKEAKITSKILLVMSIIISVGCSQSESQSILKQIQIKTTNYQEHSQIINEINVISSYSEMRQYFLEADLLAANMEEYTFLIMHVGNSAIIKSAFIYKNSEHCEFLSKSTMEKGMRRGEIDCQTYSALLDIRDASKLKEHHPHSTTIYFFLSAQGEQLSFVYRDYIPVPADEIFSKVGLKKLSEF